MWWSPSCSASWESASPGAPGAWHCSRTWRTLPTGARSPPAFQGVWPGPKIRTQEPQWQGVMQFPVRRGGVPGWRRQAGAATGQRECRDPTGVSTHCSARLAPIGTPGFAFARQGDAGAVAGGALACRSQSGSGQALKPVPALPSSALADATRRGPIASMPRHGTGPGLSRAAFPGSRSAVVVTLKSNDSRGSAQPGAHAPAAGPAPAGASP